MEQKIVKVNCSFCGKEIESPENMLSAEKHSCFECFEKLEGKLSEEEILKIHVDIPKEKMGGVMASALSMQLLEEAFPQLWSDMKEDLKEMSRKEGAQKMFLIGASLMAEKIMREIEEEDNKETAVQK